jgi:site-specific DNA-methyltransferase (adenine-specific)
MVTPVGRLAQRHRFQAPLPVLAAFVRMATKPGDWVVDPFAGGGSTLKVASDLGRRAWGCDVDEAAVKQARVNLGLHAADGRGSRHEPDAGDDD